MWSDVFDKRQGHIHSRVQGLDQCLIGGGVIIFLGTWFGYVLDRRRGRSISGG